jgi:uncharacterized protein YoxC
MSEEIKDVNAKIDEAEAAVKKYASADTVISVGGYEFTPAKLMVAFTLVSSIIGGLYGCFQVYNDYMGMKDKISKYVAPDLSEFDKRLAVLEQNSQKQVDSTDVIKNDLKGDIRRLGDVVDNVERSAKQSQRETDQSVRDVQQELRRNTKENEQAIKQVQHDVDAKIQKALDNPLSGH